MHRLHFQLRCRHCAWSEICGPTRVADWLRQAGKVRPGREPEPEILFEIFRGSAEQFTCPDCGAAGLTATEVTEDFDWPGERACQGCGRPIPAERLEALPDAQLCARCQQAEEQGLPLGPVEFCPRCGAPMAVRQSRTGGVTRYVLACTSTPPCRL